MRHSRFKLEWKVGYTDDPSSVPEKWVAASVPGAVQLDWARAEGWSHCWQDGEVEKYEWMEKVYWIYQASLPQVELNAVQRLFFVAGGIDYRFLIRIGGLTVHAQEGMFTPVEIDLSEYAEGEKALEVVVFPSASAPRNMAEATRLQQMKPVVSYGTNFHPRIVPSGIWKETYLERRESVHIRDLYFDCLLDEGLSKATVDLSVELSEGLVGDLEWSLLDPSGEVVDGESIALLGQGLVDATCEVHDPLLWWPRGYGDQNRYTLTVSLHAEDGRVLDQRTRWIGFRTSRLVANKGGSVDLGSSPGDGKFAPMALEVNGTRLFVKGAHWVCPDIFPGVSGEDAYRPLLEKAAGANLNLLLCWGGAPVAKESFFDLCDRLGIMVWQEFPVVASGDSESPEFLDTIDQESDSILRQLKGHPCLVIWSGGAGDRFEEATGVSEQTKSLRLLNKKCFEHDPETPFLATPFVFGVDRGCHVFLDTEEQECFAALQNAVPSACIGFALPGPASHAALQRLIPEDELFPPRPAGVWQKRHGFKALANDAESWLCLPTIERYFGRPESIEELVGWGQLLQSEGLKSLFEEARRKQPFCAMAICWCLNEPWPSSANASLLSWPCEAKPALAAVRQSCRPTLASARVRKFAWRAGELFEAELWMLHDGLNSVKGDRVEAYLRFDDDESFMLGWFFDALEPAQNRIGPVLRCVIPEMEAQSFRLILKVEGRPDWNSEYEFCFLPADR